MSENEDKTTVAETHEEALEGSTLEADEDAILPDGYDGLSGLENFLAGIGTTDVNTDMDTPETPETPAIPDEPGTEKADEEPAPNSGPDTPGTDAGEKPEKSERVLKITVNHQDSEFNVDAASDEELTAIVQKAKAFDEMREQKKGDLYRQNFQQQLDRGMSEEVARMVAREAAGGKDYPLNEDDAAKEEKPEKESGTTDAENRMGENAFRGGLDQIRAIYPDFHEIPKEVSEMVAKGTIRDAAGLVSAYSAFRAKNTSAEAEQLRKENALLKSQMEAARRAPVTKGVSGGGAVEKTRDTFRDLFEKGLNSAY